LIKPAGTPTLEADDKAIYIDLKKDSEDKGEVQASFEEHLKELVIPHREEPVKPVITKKPISEQDRKAEEQERMVREATSRKLYFILEILGIRGVVHIMRNQSLSTVKPLRIDYIAMFSPDTLKELKLRNSLTYQRTEEKDYERHRMAYASRSPSLFLHENFLNAAIVSEFKSTRMSHSISLFSYTLYLAELHNYFSFLELYSQYAPP
jgi:hypothetical protein